MLFLTLQVASKGVIDPYIHLTFLLFLLFFFPTLVIVMIDGSPWIHGWLVKEMEGLCEIHTQHLVLSEI